MTVEIHQLIIEARVSDEPPANPLPPARQEYYERRLIEKIKREVLLALREKQERL